MAHPLGSPSYVRLTTFRRSGDPVGTPVWFAPTGVDGQYVFTTLAGSGKVKRLRHNPAVEVAACDVRGRVRPGTPTYRGTAELVDDAHEVEAAVAVMRRRYGIQFRAMEAWDRVRGLVGRAPENAVIRVTLASDA